MFAFFRIKKMHGKTESILIEFEFEALNLIYMKNIHKTLYARSIFVFFAEEHTKVDNFYALQHLNVLNNFQAHMTSQNDALWYRIYFKFYMSVLENLASSKFN